MLILTICLPISSSDTIYKYKDENGVLRFADHPPLTGQPVETFEAYTPEAQKLVYVTKTNSDGKIQLSIVNQLHGPVEVELSFKKLENLISRLPLPRRFFVPGRSELTAVHLQVDQPDLSWQ